MSKKDLLFVLIRESFMKVAGKGKLDKVMEFKYGLTVQDTRESG